MCISKLPHIINISTPLVFGFFFRFASLAIFFSGAFHRANRQHLWLPSELSLAGYLIDTNCVSGEFRFLFDCVRQPISHYWASIFFHTKINNIKQKSISEINESSMCYECAMALVGYQTTALSKICLLFVLIDKLKCFVIVLDMLFSIC